MDINQQSKKVKIMIQANELRHNNYYILNGKAQQYNILSYGQWNLNCYEPIPLTHEILDKCGFEKDKDGVYNINGYAINKVMYWLDTGHLQIALAYTPILNAPCKYLHQLQNLYFALTGEELTFKP